MFYITGRVNADVDIEETEADLMVFIHEFFSEELIVCRETNKKCGLPTHLHYHFLLSVEDEPEKCRAKIRKWLTDRGYKKHMSSVKVTEDKEKAIYYVCKQQDVLAYTMEDDVLQQWLESSKSYNDTLRINNWNEHLEQIIGILQNEEREYYDRAHTLNTIHNYIVQWNKTANREHQISFAPLHPAKVYTLFQQIESIILPQETAFDLLMHDCLQSVLNQGGSDAKVRKLKKNI